MDYVISLSDETGEKRSDKQLAIMAEAVRKVVNGFDYDIDSYGNGESFRKMLSPRITIIKTGENEEDEKLMMGFLFGGELTVQVDEFRSMINPEPPQNIDAICSGCGGAMVTAVPVKEPLLCANCTAGEKLEARPSTAAECDSCGKPSSPIYARDDEEQLCLGCFLFETVTPHVWETIKNIHGEGT